jgi:anti-sigma regulatory factor (Ser/Thr protein kinase)
MRWTLPVRTRDEIDFVRSEVRGIAAACGFDLRGSTEIAIVAVELATNILKYGIHGWIELGKTEEGIEIVAWDHGPPFRDFHLALEDDHDDRGKIDPMTLPRRGGFGGGLGAVRRLTDALECTQHGPRKCVRAVRRLRRPTRR